MEEFQINIGDDKDGSGDPLKMKEVKLLPKSISISCLCIPGLAGRPRPCLAEISDSPTLIRNPKPEARNLKPSLSLVMLQ